MAQWTPASSDNRVMEGMLANRDVPQRECYGIGDVPLAKARPIGEMGGGVARKTWFHPTVTDQAVYSLLLF